MESKFTAVNVKREDFREIRVRAAWEGKPMYKLIREAFDLYRAAKPINGEKVAP